MLADKEEIYELQTHNIKPDSTDKYLKNWYVIKLNCYTLFKTNKSIFLLNPLSARKMQVW